MIFIKYDGAGNITAKNFMPFDEVYGLGKTKEQLQLEGILVDSLPEAEERVGMDATLKINISTNEFYHEYHERMLTPVEMISNLQNLLKTPSQKFEVLDKETTPLADYKKAKMAQLDEFCNLAIVNGFKHTVGETEYLFSCSLSAQANFTGTDLLFKDGFITETQWSAVDVATEKVERVILTKTEFNKVKLKVFQHINANISKFRNVLQAQVESALTNDEVDSVRW